MKTKTAAQTCDVKGPNHAYLGHYRKDQYMNAGHNTIETIPAQGGKPAIKFKKGGLHQSLGVPQGQPIPAGKKAAARAGKYGPKAKKQAMFAQNVLVGRNG